MINFLWILINTPIQSPMKKWKNKWLTIAEKKIQRKQLTEWIKEHSYTMEQLIFGANNLQWKS